MKRFMNTLMEAREKAARARIRQYLRGLSDRALEDMGFSRDLLEQGPQAWPWRAPAEPLGEPNPTAAARAAKAESYDRRATDHKLAA